MTTQIRSKLNFDNLLVDLEGDPLAEKVSLWKATLPLGAVLKTPTSCYRGYVTHWLINSSRLYLVKVEGMGVPQLTSELIFPGKSLPLFADWFSGEVVAITGKAQGIVFYDHPKSLEKTIFYVRDGIVCDTNVIKNI